MIVVRTGTISEADALVRFNQGGELKKPFQPWSQWRRITWSDGVGSV